MPVKPLSGRRLRNGHAAMARNLHDCERRRASLPKAGHVAGARRISLDHFSGSLDLLILMVTGRPQDRPVGRVAWKDPGEFGECLESPQHFLGVRSGRGCAGPFFDRKKKYHN